jgi:hypothetical protein
MPLAGAASAARLLPLQTFDLAKSAREPILEFSDPPEF